jgi:hypothetical protein
MKAKKKNPKYTRKVEIWFQPTNDLCISSANRLRLVGGDQPAYYMPSDDVWCDEPHRCCWDYNLWNASLKEKLEAMHKYDKKRGFPRAIKIGEFYE